MFVGDTQDAYPKPDGKYIFDKLSSVYISGNATRDDAPNHIRVHKQVPREIAETWRYMCPAGVYEIPDDAPETGPVDVIVNYTNCVQCGAITAKGGRLTPPEGGDGPLYTDHVGGSAARRRAARLPLPPRCLVECAECPASSYSGSARPSRARCAAGSGPAAAEQSPARRPRDQLRSFVLPEGARPAGARGVGPGRDAAGARARRRCR